MGHTAPAVTSAWPKADLKRTPASSPRRVGKQKTEAHGQQNQERVTASLLRKWAGRD